jgi:hypothetical protein
VSKGQNGVPEVIAALIMPEIEALKITADILERDQ